jgi:hypothetical protein
MKARAYIAAALSIFIISPQLDAYTVPSLVYGEDLYAPADLVVIAEPSAASRDTSERSILRGVTPNVPVIGINTEFRTLFVFKGSKRARFILHHYRAVKQKPNPNMVMIGPGPLLLEIAPPKKVHGIPETPKRYLMFLVREPDGRFAPVAGQQDVDGISVQEVSGATVD